MTRTGQRPGRAADRANGSVGDRSGAVLAHSCNRCGFRVTSRALGCKNPCQNCGTVYPLGDCSD